jgi:hypothetical protein
MPHLSATFTLRATRHVPVDRLGRNHALAFSCATSYKLITIAKYVKCHHSASRTLDWAVIVHPALDTCSSKGLSEIPSSHGSPCCET